MIKNLLFDLGGVIMDIKKDNCVEAFRALGLQDASAFFGDFAQQGPFAKIEEGKITPDQFHEEIRSLLPNDVSDEAMDEAFIKFLIGIPVERLRMLAELHRRYGMYLLSNTNSIMWHTFIASEFRKDGRNINYYFDGIVTSFEAKALKPSPEIFQYTIEKLGIDPEETIFFDDSQKNLDAAARFGFATCLVPEGQDIREIIPRILKQYS